MTLSLVPNTRSEPPIFFSFGITILAASALKNVVLATLVFVNAAGIFTISLAMFVWISLFLSCTISPIRIPLDDCAR